MLRILRLVLYGISHIPQISDFFNKQEITKPLRIGKLEINPQDSLYGKGH
jgi:hypothetical protein